MLFLVVDRCFIFTVPDLREGHNFGGTVMDEHGLPTVGAGVDYTKVPHLVLLGIIKTI